VNALTISRFNRRGTTSTNRKISGFGDILGNVNLILITIGGIITIVGVINNSSLQYQSII
jgi:hypothetical protein